MDRRCIGCKKPIDRRYVTCETCWWSLPLDMRIKFSARRDAERTAIAIEMVHWFRDNAQPEERKASDV